MFPLRATSSFAVLITAVKVAFGTVLAGVFLSGGATAQSADAGKGVSSGRPPLAMRVPQPPVPVAVEGSSQLVYELHLTNSARQPLTLQRIEILDAKGRTLLARIGGDLLGSRLHPVDNPTAGKEPLAVSPGGRGVVYLEVALEGDAGLLELEHRVTFHLPGRAAQQSVGARIPIKEGPAPVLAAPLRGGPWVAIHSPAWERGHRRVIYTVDDRERIPGRHAIDWMKVDAGGRVARGDRDRVENWLGYGAEVLAVADAKVVAVRDDFPESATMSAHRNPPPEEATGNYIVLDIGNGRYAFYEHLKPASIRVKAGERVHRGQVIASLGFTGQTAGPHLHFHVADAKSPLGAEGIPFVIEGFTVLGTYGDIGRLGKAPWEPAADEGGVGYAEEKPAPNVVLLFDSGD